MRYLLSHNATFFGHHRTLTPFHIADSLFSVLVNSATKIFLQFYSGVTHSPVSPGVVHPPPPSDATELCLCWVFGRVVSAQRHVAEESSTEVPSVWTWWDDASTTRCVYNKTDWQHSSATVRRVRTGPKDIGALCVYMIALIRYHAITVIIPYPEMK